MSATTRPAGEACPFAQWARIGRPGRPYNASRVHVLHRLAGEQNREVSSMALYREALERFDEVYARARAAGQRNVDAMSLATVGTDGRPSNRMVLLRGVDERGFAFYTDRRSRKGADLAANPIAAACFYWEPIEEQVRMEGRIEAVTESEIEEDYAARPRAARILHWASTQSRPLDSREALVARVNEISERHPRDPVPRPESWAGYRLVPERIEFWRGARDRLHERVVYAREGGTWHRGLLQP